MRRILRSILEMIPIVAISFRYIRDAYALAVPMKKTNFGFLFSGNKAMISGEFEPVETKIFEELVDGCDVVINVGANIGWYCCLAKRKDKQVVAFEPLNLNFRYFARNMVENHWSSGLEVHQLALSNEVGIIKIYGGSTGASLIKGWAGALEENYAYVPTNLLDNIVADRFDGKRMLVVMDIEGAEYFALLGATKILDRSPRPIWMLEISVNEHQPEGTTVNPRLLETFEIFWQRGYTAETADQSRRTIGREEVAEVVRTGVNTLGTHNFIFR